MWIMTLIMSAMVVMTVKKDKMPVFGQMTLTGLKALDWLKNGTNVQVSKIWMGSATLFDAEWNLPDWAKEKGVIALLFPVTEFLNPILVTQKSVLKVLEAKCAEWEAAGCAVNVLTISGTGAVGQIAEIQFSENEPIMEFSRDPNGPTYAGYTIEFD